MINFVAHNWDTIATVVTLVGGYLYNKARGRKTDDIWDTALKIGKQVLPRLLKDAKLYDDAYVNAEIRKYIVAGLTRVKLTLPDALIDEAVEHIHGELAEMAMKYNLDRYIEVSSGTAAMLKAGA